MVLLKNLYSCIKSIFYRPIKFTVKYFSSNYWMLPSKTGHIREKFDLFMPSDVVLPPKEVVKVNMGVSLKIPAGYVFVLDRGDTRLYKDIKIINRLNPNMNNKEVILELINISNEPQALTKGMFICSVSCYKPTHIKVNYDLCHLVRDK